MVNYYTDLDIDQSLEGQELEKEIKKIQRKWILRTNAPDLNLKQEAERKISLIEEAKLVILDSDKRKEYDLELQAGESYNYEEDTEEDYYNDVDKLIDDAWDLIVDEKYADAIVVAKRAVEIASMNPYSWSVLAYAHYCWGDVDDAIYEYKKAIDITPNVDIFYYHLGEIYLDSAHKMLEKNKDNEADIMLSDAFKCANKALSIEPNNTDNRILMARISIIKDDIDTAIEIYKDVMSSSENHEWIKDVLADLYFEKGKRQLPMADNGGYSLSYIKNTEKMIEYMKKAKNLVNKAEYNNFINNGEKAIIKKEEEYKRSMEKVFDKANLPALIIPILMFLDTGLWKIIGIITMISVIYISIVPRYKLSNTRFSLRTFREKIYLILIFPFLSAFKLIVEKTKESKVKD